MAEETQQQQPAAYFVAVHIGAGYHSQSKTGAYRALCNEVCQSVSKLLQQGATARNAVAEAIALLENSPLTNAGVGSNLNLNGKIECDASIMDAGGFGSVGALSNVKNPIMVSLSLLNAQSKGTLSMGRIVPCMLVGEGAKLWASENQIEMVDDNYHKTESMVKSFDRYRNLLPLTEPTKATPTTAATSVRGEAAVDNCANSEECSIKAQFDKEDEDATCALDTVGAIVLDQYGHFASAASSGGILLKYPGRVGHAAMFGCGCWVEEDIHPSIDDPTETMSIAVCTTGCGEYIMKTMFARECCSHLIDNKDEVQYNLGEFFQKKFFKAPLIRHQKDKYVGAMVCILDTYKNQHHGELEKSVELIVTHTTPSICFGFMASEMREATTVMSRMGCENGNNNNEKADGSDGDEAVMISNFRVNLNQKIIAQTAERFFKRNFDAAASASAAASATNNSNSSLNNHYSHSAEEITNQEKKAKILN